MDAKPILHAGRGGEVTVYVPPSTLTIKEIQDQIPAKYFQKSLFRGLYYVLRDILQVIITCVIMYYYVLPFVSTLELFLNKAGFKDNMPRLVPISIFCMKLIAWSMYWFVQGLNGTALWVMAHECGHQAFSRYRDINNLVGLVLHSSLLVPFHSWRITHGNHHKHTNHLTKDTVFIPRKESHIIQCAKQAPLIILFDMIEMFLFGWPAHLLWNATGQKFDRRANHFEPSSPLFRPEDASDIVISDIGIIAVLGILGYAGYHYGFANVFCWYIVPYLWVNFWLVYITYLQHSDLRLPHYTNDEWTFVRGAVSSIDRDYGALLNEWLHHINDSHIVHHLFSQVPFYNAIVITRECIKNILGDMYVSDNSPLLSSLRRTWINCRYVVPSEGICVFYGPQNNPSLKSKKN